ncbi:MAG TPA: penicillin-binding protein activator [Hyphomicrobiaceae bacterium]|nr:penicillin-binding protein activator [Hyphomicrobiaceae bacterium]
MSTPALPRVLRFACTLAAVGVTAVSLAACSSGSTSATPEYQGLKTGSVASRPDDPKAITRKDGYGSEPVRKVALLLPLSGPQQALGRQLRQAGELALFERDGARIELLVKDDRGTPDGARVAAEDAIRAGAELILGPVFSGSVAAVGPVAERNGVPVIAFSNDHRVAGKGVHLLSFLPSQDVSRLVEVAARQGRKRFAVAAPDDAFGRYVEPLIEAAVMRHGGVIAARSRHAGTSAGATTCAATLRQQIDEAERAGGPIDAIVVPGGPAVLQRMAQALFAAGVDTRRIKLMGTGAWEGLSGATHPTSLGAWYAAPDVAGWRDFVGRYTKAYGMAPPRLATLTFDAVSAAVVIASAPSGRRLTASDLMRPQGFPGTEGAFRLTSSGLSERALAIIELTREGPQLVEAAAFPAEAKPAGPTASLYGALPYASAPSR